MPPAHAQFIEALQRGPSLRNFGNGIYWYTASLHKLAAGRKLAGIIIIF